MSRIAVIADIHGNVPALEAVIEDIEAQEFDEVLVAGDLVGRGPQGSEVVGAVRARGWRCIRGNHEDFLLSLRSGAPRPDDEAPRDLSCHRWMADQLSTGDAQFLAALPGSMTVGGHDAQSARVVHGSPASAHEGLGPWTSDDDLRRHLDSIPEDVLIVAHTHRPMVRTLDEGLVVNVGSVGLSFDGDWRACYGVFETLHGRWKARHRRVVWDRPRFLEIYRESGFLASGGITAALLEMEVRTARSHLVPFLVWARATGRPEDFESLRLFVELFDPERGLQDLMERSGPTVVR
jgi:predicted phosphodiesterase